MFEMEQLVTPTREFIKKEVQGSTRFTRGKQYKVEDHKHYKTDQQQIVVTDDTGTIQLIHHSWFEPWVEQPMTPSKYQSAALRTMADQGKIADRMFRIEMQNNLDYGKKPWFNTQIDNAARGMAADVGEVNDCVQKCLEYGQPLDLVNMKEELGDVLWRIVQMCDACGFTLEEVMEANIAKLAKRYPEKYTDYHAANRDLKAEREALKKAESNRYIEKREQNGQGFAEPPEDESDVPLTISDQTVTVPNKYAEKDLADYSVSEIAVELKRRGHKFRIEQCHTK